MENTMMEKGKRVVQTPICLSPKTVKALDAQAQREGLVLRGRSVVVRRACTEYLQRHHTSDQAQEETA